VWRLQLSSNGGPQPQVHGKLASHAGRVRVALQPRCLASMSSWPPQLLSWLPGSETPEFDGVYGREPCHASQWLYWSLACSFIAIRVPARAAISK
jgi:hypothetical protein